MTKITEASYDLQRILGEFAIEVYRLKLWKGDVGDYPDTEEEKWFDKMMELILKIQ